jgi:membrane protease YdiL (CAAX protease family)
MSPSGSTEDSPSAATHATASLPREFLQYANPRRFFALALGLSWLFWTPIALLGLEPFSMPGIGLFALGGLGPAAAEFVLILREADPAYVQDYRQRVLDNRRIGPRWGLVVLLFFPVVNGIALGLVVLDGGSLPAFGTATDLLADPITILPYAGFIMLFGPLPEELGWRGYALDGLQARWSALAASLILGTLWAAWHLPLFFMAGSFQAELGLFTPQFAFYTGSIVVSSILYTWIYNNTNRSTLSAILFHFMTNFSGELMGLSDRARLYQFGLITLAAMLVVLAWGPGTLTGNPRERSAGVFGS